MRLARAGQHRNNILATTLTLAHSKDVAFLGSATHHRYSYLFGLRLHLLMAQLSVCVNGWLILCALISQSATGVQPHPE